jgi:NAD(P)-dependent dehydrogenase (short-subunit alcohol dehydrogenase family)
MSISLQNKTALVIGASSGIGRATALALAKHKAKVALVARRQSILDDLATRCGPLASAYACDITDDGKVEQLAAKIRADFAQIDILVHSSGIIKIGKTEDASVVDFDAQFAANVRGPYLLTKFLLPNLRSASGQIVLVNSSITRASKTDGRGAFAATQHALLSIANTLRDEVNGAGVRVTTVYPGTTATERQIELYAITGKKYYPDRMLRPEDVAEAVMFALTIGRTAEITDLYLRPMLKPLL